jgi:CheY-like chemotaxis protein
MPATNFFPSSGAKILLVEDDPGDRELIGRALQEVGLQVDLGFAADGQEALDLLLRGRCEDSASPRRPNLILLDLNMPRVNGYQVLAELRKYADLDRIPVVVLTTSRQQQDIARSYDLGANSFVSKPAEISLFNSTVRELGHYWFELVALPPTVEPAFCEATSRGRGAASEAILSARPEDAAR